MSNKAISSSDPNALEKLNAKLEACEKRQTFMKEVNAYYRKFGTCKGCPGVPDEMAAKIDVKIESSSYSWDKQPFASYELTSNNSEIRRIKQRINEIERHREVGFVGWKFAGGEAVVNNNINRLQLFFDERPDKERCSVLKHKGFHWSPREGAWQRQLNDNAIYAVNYVDFVKPLDGRRPTDLQPKAPQRDTGAR
ncbi:DUF3560 domain-containing protein [Pelotomaculum terephthalicicum JT]|uniref:DUF3560 domain-containing protein n=1 Tax=Pelotomaculum terephthalicicum TaxID=206393 RepID=UPI001F042951|nr:DUF3560 domain-containing protein [Pelotomaculum terephthalicicum]MCG9968375.1 DUF3560 domain-containing protein [Pelotomaculum terephthalicicum JT]